MKKSIVYGHHNIFVKLFEIFALADADAAIPRAAVAGRRRPLRPAQLPGAAAPAGGGRDLIAAEQPRHGHQHSEQTEEEAAESGQETGSRALHPAEELSEPAAW